MSKAVNSVLVIGGGTAGIKTALNLAKVGVKVYLIEKSLSIGGNMARLSRVFPTFDYSVGIEATDMLELYYHPNITLVTNCEVKRVTGSAGNFEVILLQKPRLVDEGKCDNCGKCIEVCPVSVADEFDGRIGGVRKLIYLPFPHAIPSAYTIDERCRYGKMYNEGACVGSCKIDCIQCRECPISKCTQTCLNEKKEAIILWQPGKILRVKVASIIITTGFELIDIGMLKEWEYTKTPNVLTNLEFERILNTSGPTNGEIIRVSDGEKADSILLVTCIGREHVGYCSRYCCMSTLKEAIQAKEYGVEDVTALFTEIKTHGKGYECLYRNALKQGIRILRGKLLKVREEGNKVKTSFWNIITNQMEEEMYDMVVLALAALPSRDLEKLSNILGIELNPYGFVKIKENWNPVETTRPGIYACGGATWPKDITETIQEASVAATMALSHIRYFNV